MTLGLQLRLVVITYKSGKINLRESHPFDQPLELVLDSEPELAAIVAEIRRQKTANVRPKPSSQLIDKSALMTANSRQMLLDKIAELVDENYCGRSEMCRQFAMLLSRALNQLGIPSRIVTGTVAYYDDKGQTVYKWPDDGHDWVLAANEIVDGNIDILFENIFIPDAVTSKPYWGTPKEAPKDRKYIENRGARTVQADDDVDQIWWPELQSWITEHMVSVPSL